MDFLKTDGKIYLEENGKELASITYQEVEEDTYDATSTFVDPSLRGQGVAEKLVETLTEQAEDENKKIIPTCPYIEKLFDRKSDRYAKVDARNK